MILYLTSVAKQNVVDWQHTQLLHVFQQQLVSGGSSHNGISSKEAIVDLRNVASFQEDFYLLVLEKAGDGGSLVHMWRIIIASDNIADGAQDTPKVQVEGEKQYDSFEAHQTSSSLNIKTTKVCTQMLDLPGSVEVINATVAAGHLSSSSIYPACFAPYLISTACSDSKVRFWRCKASKGQVVDEEVYNWVEWHMVKDSPESSSIPVRGKPIAVCCAYSGRVAVAYRLGSIKTEVEHPETKFVNLSVAIYECESTGGSEWTLEDTIDLKHTLIPDPHEEISMPGLAPGLHSEGATIPKSMSIPSLSSAQSVRRSIIEKGNIYGLLKQKHLVQLDWVSTEDGSHILTIGLGFKVLLYAPVSGELANSVSQREPEKKEHKPRGRGMLQKSKSVMVLDYVEEIRWMKLRSIEFATADALPPLPMHISWVRDGILVVGMDNEMHVYSQWRAPEGTLETSSYEDETDGTDDSRTLKEENLVSVSSSANLLMVTRMPGSPFKGSSSMTSMKVNLSTSSSYATERRSELSQGKLSKSESSTSLNLIQECGLFEAARLANPVLPQYHPKQLLELLNFGKIRRVKAILAHLVRCIAGHAGLKSLVDVSDPQSKGFGRQRALSVAAGSSPGEALSPAAITGEVQLDYVEINSIPPLPLYALLASDNDTQQAYNDTTDNNKNEQYDDLFDSVDKDDDDLDDTFTDEVTFGDLPVRRERAQSANKISQNPNYFGTSQAGLLTNYLTHTHLPGLTNLDQMYLLALADTVANCKTDFGDDSSSATGEGTKNESVDECGLRFLLSMKLHIYLLRSLPLAQRANLQKEGLGSATIVWAFHSEAEEELLGMIPSVAKGEPTWKELSQFGVGWWVRNDNTLRRLFEKVAKAAFTVNKDPLDAAIFYLAMKKKMLLWGLFRSVQDTKMSMFFKNNFSEDRWRRAALKNAFALLGRQRFQHAAAFFLLAGALRDAIEVCLNKMEDIQLAMVIARLYESELDDVMPANLKRLFKEEILGYDANGENYRSARAHPDPFLRSMANWNLKEYNASLETLMDTGIGHSHPVRKKPGYDSGDTKPQVFNFYNYLRTHPLLIRQQLASTAADKGQSVLLSGFSHGAQLSAGSQNVTYTDKITPVERRLFFSTAYKHFRAGCPALALEVLTKLPLIMDVSTDSDIHKAPSISVTDTALDTGTLGDFTTQKPLESANDFDWSTPATQTKAEEFDWGAPSFKIEDDEPDFGIPESDDDSDDNDKVEDDKPIEENDKPETEDSQKKGVQKGEMDLMGQQLKYIACLKIMMEELSTLATGFEVDGGQLRFQLYMWLEREVEMLKQLCHYGGTLTEEDASQPAKGTSSEHDDKRNSRPSLHEIILADQSDFEAKLERMARRKQWLHDNQQLLRNCLSYCSLQGACGGGLASVRMELILLLQELQQEKTQQQLLSPLPFPTTLPLLSACVASAKTVIADPIRHIDSLTKDLLHSVVEFTSPPDIDSTKNKVFVLRNLSAALSACIYQCLCDSDSFTVAMSDSTEIGMEAFSSVDVVKDNYLVSGAVRRRRQSSNSEDTPNSQPSKWPGVASLRSLLAREKDDDAPKMNILLCEALIGVYMSLLIHALSTYDANTLYRLVSHVFSEKMWNVLFGGGLKKLVKSTESAQTVKGQDDLSKQRIKFHLKVLGQQGSSQTSSEGKQQYKDKFVPPKQNMVTYFMTKPYVPPDAQGIDCIDYDSDVSLDSEDDYNDENSLNLHDEGMQQHSDPTSYSWCLLRYAIMKYVLNNMKTFLPQVGLEIPELPVSSPLLQAVVSSLGHWEMNCLEELEQFPGPPDDYIPGCYTDSTNTGPAILKYKAMLEPINTPFLCDNHSSLPCKRLWHYLVKKEILQDVFIRFIFKKRKVAEPLGDTGGDVVDTGVQRIPSPVKIIHKDQDIITAFAINQANLNCVALAVPKEVIEMEVSGILNPPSWLEDDTEYDIETIKNNAPSSQHPDDFLVIQTPSEQQETSSGSSVHTPTAPGVVPAPTYNSSGMTGRGGSVMSKRNLPNIRRMGSHPHLPYYLTGGTDGSVKLYEWGHDQCISTAREPGTQAKVTKILFNAQGNKFGVAEGEGSLCLWQVGLGVNMSKPFMKLKCHTKTTYDFTFVGSSSLLATAGASTDNKNVCLWDTLMSPKNSLVHSFACHDSGAPSLLYAAQNQCIISGGKRGEICIFDIRQRQIRHTFQAHESSVRCLAMDPSEEFFITGSSDGDIKIWGLTVHQLMASLPGEHAKSSIFRNMHGAHTGCIQLMIGPRGHLYSCGADGSLKVRQLPDRDIVVQSVL
ncbi:unnamed protein product [Owenia fusiformis]|uniref:Uncharacterized protein n=1 Tax=Owenia fusiformis TaxID=6347 RepID=A0A8J1XUU7_OWEFU|nr:unnamed protein product [Owenia fusiformis]